MLIYITQHTLTHNELGAHITHMYTHTRGSHHTFTHTLGAHITHSHTHLGLTSHTCTHTLGAHITHMLTHTWGSHHTHAHTHLGLTLHTCTHTHTHTHTWGSHCRLLSQLPEMFSTNKTSEVILEPVIRTGMETLKVRGKGGNGTGSYLLFASRPLGVMDASLCSTVAFLPTRLLES